MKGFNRIHLVALATATAFVVAGCGHKHEERHAQAEHAQEAKFGVTFNAKKGLLVPPETAKFLGLQVADVEERKIAATFQFSAQVYCTATEAQFASLQPGSRPDALASGNVSAVAASKLNEGQAVTVQGGDGPALAGRIVAIKHDLAATSGQVEVLVAVSDSPQPLASGSLINVTVALGGDKPVASVPCSALFRTTEGDFVYTVSGEHFMRALVKLG